MASARGDGKRLPPSDDQHGPLLGVRQRKVPCDTLVSQDFTRFQFGLDGRARRTVTSAGERQLQRGIRLNRLGHAAIRTHVGDRPEPI